MLSSEVPANTKEPCKECATNSSRTVCWAARRLCAMANPPNIPRTPGRHEDEVFMNASGPWSGVRATSICFSIVDSSPVGAIVVSGEPPGGLQSTALLFIRITLKIAVSLLETEGRKLHRMTRVHGNNSALLWGLSPVCACGPAVRSIDIDSGGIPRTLATPLRNGILTSLPVGLLSVIIPL